MSKALTVKQQAFVENYVRSSSITDAARKAGYSAENAYRQGYRLMQEPEILESIAERLRVQRMDTDEVVARLADIARGSLGDFVRIAPDGTPQIDLAAASDRLHLIKRLRIRTTPEGTVSEIELYDAQQALAVLSRYALFMAEAAARAQAKADEEAATQQALEAASAWPVAKRIDYRDFFREPEDDEAASGE